MRYRVVGRRAERKLYLVKLTQQLARRNVVAVIPALDFQFDRIAVYGRIFAESLFDLLEIFRELAYKFRIRAFRCGLGVFDKLTQSLAGRQAFEFGFELLDLVANMRVAVFRSTQNRLIYGNELIETFSALKAQRLVLLRRRKLLTLRAGRVF